MIVLGEKYTFTALEIEQLKRKNRDFVALKYKNISDDEVIDKLESLVQKHHIIILNTKAQISHKLIQYLTKLELLGIKYYTIESFLEKYLQKCYISQEDTDLQYLANIKPYTPFQYFLKRCIDYVGSVTLYFIAFPVIYYSRRRVKRESPGSSMYKQFRVGLNGKEFKCVKFRSMSMDAEKEGAQFASKEDKRVFEWGEKMRRARIDELPQLLNVVRGEMHLVGPRPERKIWIDVFEQTIPYYHQRHIVKPGITGWAQVMYPYGTGVEDARQKLMYDLYYIKYWSLGLEFKIIWKTIFVILGRHGI